MTERDLQFYTEENWVAGFYTEPDIHCSVSYLFISMTRNQLVKFWRNLWFWQRALIECSIVVLFFLWFELILHGRGGDFGDATIEGVALGLFYAIIDHAFLAPNRKRADRRG